MEGGDKFHVEAYRVEFDPVRAFWDPSAFGKRVEFDPLRGGGIDKKYTMLRKLWRDSI